MIQTEKALDKAHFPSSTTWSFDMITHLSLMIEADPHHIILGYFP